MTSLARQIMERTAPVGPVYRCLDCGYHVLNGGRCVQDYCGDVQPPCWEDPPTRGIAAELTGEGAGEQCR